MVTVVSQEARGQIKRLCAYIKDDSTIASYMGVPKAFVTRLRKELPVIQTIGGRRIVREIRHIQPDNGAGRISNHAAEHGSRRLAEKIDALIHKASLELDMPPEYRASKVSRKKFAMAYLGFEVIG